MSEPLSAFISWDFLEAMPDAVLLVNEGGLLEHANAQALSLFGYTRDELMGQPIELLIPERFGAAHAADRHAHMAHPRPRPMGTGRVLLARRKDGGEFPAEIHLAPTPSTRGMLIAAVVRNASARQEAESAEQQLLARNAELALRVHERTAELEAANDFLDTVIESTPHALFVKDAATLTFLRVNRAAEELSGFARSALLGKHGRDLAPRFPRSQAEVSELRDRAALLTPTGQSAEYATELGGQVRWMRTRRVPIRGPDGAPHLLLVAVEDITAVRDLSQARAHLAALVESSDDAIFGCTLDGIVTSWNQGATQIFGYSADEIIGTPLARLFPPSRADEEALLARRVAAGERLHHYESIRRRKDGVDIDVSVSLSPVVDAAGTIIGTSRIVRDISAVKQSQAALARAKEAAEAANRELEAFSYSVAHDLRAPLRSIDGFSQALLEDSADQLDASGKRHLGFVRASAQHMAQLIDDLLALSRVTRAELHREHVDLTGLAEQALARLRRSQPDRRVAVVIQQGLEAEGDARLLGVVFDNLLGNAWKFTGKREEAHIAFGVASSLEAGTVTPPGEPAERVYFVRDDGAGFDMAYAHKLFGVFQRLHAATEFEGTGVGLATVQRIIRRHGGRIWAEGAVERGATFFFTLGTFVTPEAPDPLRAKEPSP